MTSSPIPNKFFSEIQRFTSDLDSWIKGQYEEAQKSGRQHQDFVKEADSKLKHLQKKERKLIQIIEQNRIDEEKENQDLENVRRQIERLREVERALPDKLELVTREAKREEHILENKRSDLDKSERQKKTTMRDFTQGLATFQQVLALEFERVRDNRLRLVFTNIDPRNPKREFYFTIYLNEADQYLLDECHPEVRCSGDLLAELNDTSNLSRFVVDMRKQFVQMAAAL